MTNLSVMHNKLPSMNEQALDKVYNFEELNLQNTQIDIETSHLIHGGMYARTIFIPGGTVLTGALIKVPTVLIICGHTLVYTGDETIEFSGYNVIQASAGRKQVFWTRSDVHLTMIFPSNFKTVKDLEYEFTDESDILMSNSSDNNKIVITGE